MMTSKNHKFKKAQHDDDDDDDDELFRQQKLSGMWLISLMHACRGQ